jgi:hypothetical protein
MTPLELEQLRIEMHWYGPFLTMEQAIAMVPEGYGARRKDFPGLSARSLQLMDERLRVRTAEKLERQRRRKMERGT